MFFNNLLTTLVRPKAQHSTLVEICVNGGRCIIEQTSLIQPFHLVKRPYIGTREIYQRHNRSSCAALKAEKIPSIRILLGHNMSSTSGNSAKQMVAVCQLNSKADKEANFKIASGIVREAASVGAKMIFLPECFDYIESSRDLSIAKAEPLNGPTINQYKELAKEVKAWLSLGGMHQKQDGSEITERDKILNAHLVIDDQGEIRAVYHKIHLFNLEIPNVVRLIEGESYIRGSKLTPPVTTPVGKVGLGICYDVRFPEMAISYAKAGADLLTYPSSFTVPTGTYHWETLVRARAIENQCYVIAAAQTGQHNEKRSSYGHAMIVDPWGTVVAHCSEGVGYALAMIDHNFLQTARSKLPIWTDRRNDVYADIEPAVDSYEIDAESIRYKFADQDIASCQVFIRTRYSFGFVNHRPVLKGHVLISPLRVCEKFTELSKAEVADLFQLVQRVERVLEELHDTKSTTLTLQDGVDAGQSVFHVHVHILPRKPTDFDGKVDQIYRELQNHDKAHVTKYKQLTTEEMSVVARELRQRFT